MRAPGLTTLFYLDPHTIIPILTVIVQTLVEAIGLLQYPHIAYFPATYTVVHVATSGRLELKRTEASMNPVGTMS